MTIELTDWMKEAAPLVSSLYGDTLVVVTTRDNDAKLNGQIALSVLPASILVEKPRLLVELWQNNLTHDLIKQSGVFAVHLLKPEQFEPVRRFGFSSGRDHDKFEGVRYHLGETGCPLLAECYGWLECRVSGQLDCRDMTVFVGEVVNARRLSEGAVLGWQIAKKTLPSDWLADYERYRRGNEEWARNVLTHNL